MMNMLRVFGVGDEISGFCNGYFGRDDYSRKVCVMVTAKYAVFEWCVEDDECAGFAVALNYSEGLEDVANKWKEM